uniref:Uncharacterized protein n=1 Tax=Meloidogyne enterolobii TaxID=390850 RepID=A0A6V7VX17_MELEN|nr:unnamed protein product [Meloidogyne enterolobii]
MQRSCSKKPKNFPNYSLYYYEVKCKIEKEILNKNLNWVNISLRNLTNKFIKFVANSSTIYDENEKQFKLSAIFNDNDIFGCGLVHPPTNLSNEEFPYIFFTKNGKQIGKGILIKDNPDSYTPCVWVQCCSIETNFGNNLETKPFKYNVSGHSILKEFY